MQKWETGSQKSNQGCTKENLSELNCESTEQFFKRLGWVEMRNTHKMRKYVVLVSSSNQIIYCLIPGTSPTQPRVKLTAGPMCIEMDELFKNKKRFSPFGFIKNVLFCQFENSIHLLACISEVISLPWTFHSLPEILFWWTHYSFQVGQSLGDWCYNLSSTAPFLAFRSTLSPDGPITGWSVLQSFSVNILAKTGFPT